MFAPGLGGNHIRASKRRSDMYIGLGTVLLIILIILLVVYVF